MSEFQISMLNLPNLVPDNCGYIGSHGSLQSVASICLYIFTMFSSDSILCDFFPSWLNRLIFYVYTDLRYTPMANRFMEQWNNQNYRNQNNS